MKMLIIILYLVFVYIFPHLKFTYLLFYLFLFIFPRLLFLRFHGYIIFHGNPTIPQRFVYRLRRNLCPLRETGTAFILCRADRKWSAEVTLKTKNPVKGILGNVTLFVDEVCGF